MSPNAARAAREPLLVVLICRCRCARLAWLFALRSRPLDDDVGQRLFLVPSRVPWCLIACPALPACARTHAHAAYTRRSRPICVPSWNWNCHWDCIASAPALGRTTARSELGTGTDQPKHLRTRINQPIIPPCEPPRNAAQPGRHNDDSPGLGPGPTRAPQLHRGLTSTSAPTPTSTPKSQPASQPPQPPPYSRHHPASAALPAPSKEQQFVLVTRSIPSNLY